MGAPGTGRAGINRDAQGRDRPDHLPDQPRVAQGGQLDQPHPIRVVHHQPPGQLHRHPGLARPTRPGHRDQPILLDQLGQRTQLLLAADKAGQRFGQVVAELGGEAAASRAGS